MRDLSERDKIREKFADRPGVSGQVERLMGERENAEAYGQEDLVKQLGEQLGGFGYKPGQARKADAEKRAAEQDEEKPGEKGTAARSQPPAGRKAAQDKQAQA